jgi:hypothetical protein
MTVAVSRLTKDSDLMNNSIPKGPPSRTHGKTIHWDIRAANRCSSSIPQARGGDMHHVMDMLAARRMATLVYQLPWPASTTSPNAAVSSIKSRRVIARKD